MTEDQIKGFVKAIKDVSSKLMKLFFFHLSQGLYPDISKLPDADVLKKMLQSKSTQRTIRIMNRLRNHDSNPDFYCKKYCGDPDFSIDKWNEEFKRCNEVGIKMEEDKPCQKQCFDCMAIVGETRLKTKALVAKLNKY